MPIDPMTILNPTTGLRCLDESDDCSGPVEYRHPGEGHKHWPRCQHHNDERVKRAEENRERDLWARTRMDPADCGERYEED